MTFDMEELDTGNSWLKYTSKHFDENYEKWKYVQDHLSGEAVDDGNIGTYLHKRYQGESAKAFGERKRIARYTPHYTRAVVALAGMLWDVERDAQRSWGALGDPEEDGTIMNRMWDDANGDGVGWPVIMRGVTVDLISQSEVWGLVEGVRRNDDGEVIREPRLRVLPPTTVPRPIYDEFGRLSTVKVKTKAQLSNSQQEKPKWEERWLVFDTEGVTTYRESDKKRPEQVGPKRFYGGEDNPDFRYVGRDGNPTLPIYRVRLPLRSQLGYLMARDANAIFNQENELDFLLRVACFPKFFGDVQNSVTGEYDEKLHSELLDSFEQGSNFLPGAGHKFDAPPVAPATTKMERLEDSVTKFYETFFQSYGDAAREKTATEIRQDARRGVEAYLAYLAASQDDFENQALLRLEQAELPDSPDMWGEASVKRSRDFQPVDIESRISGLVERYIKDRVPAGRTAVLNVLKKALELDGIEYDETELKSKVDDWMMAATSQQDSLQRVQERLNTQPAL